MTDHLPALPERRFELDQIHQMAEAIARSGLFGMKTPEQAFALMLIADAEGLHPATAAQDYNIIQGRPARTTHSLLARFQAAGGTVEWHALDDTIAEATFKHPKGGAVRLAWTIQMAVNAKLAGKDNWKMYPRSMLRARVIAEGVRTVYPAAAGGALAVEEARDIDPMVIENEPAPPPRVGRKPKQAEPPPADVIDEAPPPPAEPEKDQQQADLLGDAPKEAEPAKPAAAAKSNGPFVGNGEVTFLKNKCKSLGVTIEQVLEDAGGLVIDRLTPADFAAVKMHIRNLEESSF